MKIDAKIVDGLFETLFKLAKLISRRQSSVVTEMMVKIVQHILKNFHSYLQPLEQYPTLIHNIFEVTKKMLKNYFNTPNLIITMNMGDSVAIKECLHLQNYIFTCFEESAKIERIV